MIFKQILLILLTGHILGDYYFQTARMAARKEMEYKYVLLHCGAYAIAMLFVMLPLTSRQMYALAIWAGGIHFAVDSLKYYLHDWYLKRNIRMAATAHGPECDRKAEEKSAHKSFAEWQRQIFIGDQLVHLLTLLILAYLAGKTTDTLTVRNWIHEFFATIGIAKIDVVKWTFAVLLMSKPTNIVIQKLIGMYKPEEIVGEEVTDNKFRPGNVGRVIGTVERLTMLLLISVQQFGAIGLVLTAKSIARYDKISKDKNFAEYYLLGTLLSTMAVILCGLLLRGIE